MTETARRERIALALRALDDIGQQSERVSVQWNGHSVVIPVIFVPLEAVILNPHSHRIKAELESNVNRETVSTEPESEAAQAVIADLLCSTTGYEDLKADLGQNGQSEFGVVTRTGLLVNGNTRAVALRELGTTAIKVAVLPEDADEVSIKDLEAHLQLRVERKQPYSFPNELLFIEDLKKRSKTDGEIALQLGYAANNDASEISKGEKLVQQAIRMLALAREVERLSGGKLPLTYFEGRKTFLVEIDNEFEKSKGRNATTAQRVRDARLLGLLADVGYRELRMVNEIFLTDYLSTGIAENDVLGGTLEELAKHTDATREGDPLALFELGDSDMKIPDVSIYLDALARSHGEESVVLPGASNPVAREAVTFAFKSVIEAAAEDYKNDLDSADKVTAPLTLLNTSIRSLRKATDITKIVKERAGFDSVALEEKIASARRHLDALESVLTGVEPPADA